MSLYPYQLNAVLNTYDALRSRAGNPCIVIPTGGGKSHVIARICSDVVNEWSGQVLVVGHRKELLEQNREKIVAAAPGAGVGVYSAGVGRRDTRYPIIVGGIQSIHDKAEIFGRRDVVIVDEAHMIPFDDEGMYRNLLRDVKIVNPNAIVIGMTATPFRMKGGAICGADNILNYISYQIGVRDLIAAGYLSDLRTRAGSQEIDYSEISIRADEFVAGELERAMDADSVVELACREIVDATRDRKSIMVFCCGVKHAGHVQAVIARMTDERVELVTGNSDDRDGAIDRYRSGASRFIVNVDVLTTGFDVRRTDCVAILRATLSPGLFCQIVGRGLRLWPEKQYCLILDFGGNTMRHGPIDDISFAERASRPGGPPPCKTCPECREVIAAGFGRCPSCGYEFPIERRPAKHDATSYTGSMFSGESTDYEVASVWYCRHEKRDAPPGHPATMRVDYEVGFGDTISEWICVEHIGFAREKAEDWWAARSGVACPASAEEAARIGNASELLEPIKIRVVPDGQWRRVVGYEFAAAPEDDKRRDLFGNPDEGCPRCGRKPIYIPTMDDSGIAWNVCSWCSSKINRMPRDEYDRKIKEYISSDEVPF